MWFRVVVGLPYQGLDLSRDCNHIGDWELEAMFGLKDPMKRYIYTDAITLNRWEILAFGHRESNAKCANNYLCYIE